MEKGLKRQWNQLIQKFSNHDNWKETLWKDLHKNYRQKRRAYHNLSHLQCMFAQLEKHRDKMEDPEVLQFSIWYHDYVYQPTSQNNELKSAEFAKKVLIRLGLGQSRIDRCYRQIMLTKSHQIQPADGTDEKYFIDFDLEILGREWPDYELYTEQVRQEYWMYPDFLYRRGRKTALESFLQRDFIYQTPEYRHHLEARARLNIEREMDNL